MVGVLMGRTRWISLTTAALLALVIVGAAVPVPADDEPPQPAPALAVEAPDADVRVAAPSPVDGAPPIDPPQAAAAGPLDAPPGLPADPTFSVRVHDGTWLAWVPNVPLVVDYDGDLAPDGTLTVQASEGSATSCLLIDFKLGLSSSRASSIDFRKGPLQLRLEFGSLPSTLSACSTGTMLRPHLTLTGSATAGSLRALVTDSGRTADVLLDRTPSSLSFEVDLTQGGRVAVHHRASTSLRVDLTLSQPTVRAVIDRLPTIFDGELLFSGTDVARLDYLASTGISYLEFTWGQSWQADYFTTSLHDLPYYLDLQPSVGRVGGQISAVHLTQDASGAYGPVYFLLRSDDVPYAFSADRLPARIWDASMTPGRLTGGQGSLRVRIDADGPAQDLRLEFGLEPNPFGGTQHYLLANIAYVPSWIDATYRTSGGSLTSVALSLAAAEPIPSVVFHLQLDYASLDLNAGLYEIPSWVDASVSMSGTSYLPGAPALSIRANAPTFDFGVDARGFDFGAGRLLLSGTNIPTALDAWVSKPGSSYLGQLDISTSGSGRLGELIVDADLPVTLTGVGATHFKIGLRDVARLSIAFLNPFACTLRACAEFGYLDTGDFWWWNAPPVLFNITLWIDYKVQQLETCGFVNCWVTKYSFGGNWPNGFAYYAGQYGLDGRPARAVGSLL